MGSSVDFCRVSEMGVPTTSELYREFVKDLLSKRNRYRPKIISNMKTSPNEDEVMVLFVVYRLPLWAIIPGHRRMLFHISFKCFFLLASIQ